MPPLDLYLNKRLADFEARIQSPVLQPGDGPEAPKIPPEQLVSEACNKIYRRFRRGPRARGRKRPAGPQEPTATEKATIVVG